MNETQQQLPWWLPDPIIVFFIGFLALMYFMTIRPQQKRMKALQEMMDGLEKGDEVVAAGGSIGRMKEIRQSIETDSFAKFIKDFYNMRHLDVPKHLI